MTTPPYLFAEHLSWSLLFGFSYLAFMVVFSWVRRREQSGPRGLDRDRGSKYFIYLFSAGGALAALAIPAWRPDLTITLPHAPLFFAALAMFWAGVLLYLWAVLTLGTAFRTSVTLLEDQKLVTAGPYRVLRHPAYAGGILLFSAIGLITGNWASAVVSALTVCTGYIWRIRVEERALRERFGEAFEARRRRTWAVIPLIW